MYLTTNHVRLFKPYIILNVDGMKILFIGILTNDVLAQTRQEKLIGSFMDVKEAALEVGKICDYYHTEDIDFTVLLTHIGFERVKELAKMLDPRWGVDVIIGGHSHTLLSEPEIVAGIPIVQAASGTSQIGRFDINIDTDRNTIDSYTWRLIPVNEENCPRDTQLEEIILKYKDQTDKKYTRVLARLLHKYTHYIRNQESMRRYGACTHIRFCSAHAGRVVMVENSEDSNEDTNLDNSTLETVYYEDSLVSVVYIGVSWLSINL